MTSTHTLNRRMLLQATTLGLSSLALPRLTTVAQTPAPVDEITIDLSSEPASLAPSQVYEVNGWSVVALATPKSITIGIATPFSDCVTRILEGLMSRWMMPL